MDLSSVVSTLNVAVESDRPGANIKVLMQMYGEVASTLLKLKQRPNMSIQTLQKYKQKGMEALMRGEQLKELFDRGITQIPQPADTADACREKKKGWS